MSKLRGVALDQAWRGARLPCPTCQTALLHFNLNWTNLLRCTPPFWQALKGLGSVNALHGQIPAYGKPFRTKSGDISVSYSSKILGHS